MTSRTPVQYKDNDNTLREVYFVLPSRFKISQKALGSGTFGCVAEAENTETGEKFAVKMFKSAIFSKYDPRRALLAVREIGLLNHFNHPNIVGLKDIIISVGDKTAFETVYIFQKQYTESLGSLCFYSVWDTIGRPLQVQRK